MGWDGMCYDMMMCCYDAGSIAGMITRLRHPVSTKANKVPISVSLGSGMNTPLVS